MLEPMAIAHRQNRHYWNGEKIPRHPSQLRAREYGYDHRERMQMYSLADQTGIDDVVLDDAQHEQERQHEESQKAAAVKDSRCRCHHRDQQRSNERNELKNSGNNPQRERIGKMQKNENNRENQVDKRESCLLCENLTRR